MTIQNYVKEASKILSEMGKKTGLMVKIGEKESYIVPIFDTFVVNHAIINFEITGKEVTKYFKRLVQQEGRLPEISNNKYLIGEIKKELVYVSIDPDKESSLIKGKKGVFTRSDGIVIEIGDSRYLAAESIFNPILTGKESEALDVAIVSVLSQCEVNFRRGLCNNIVLYGSAVLPGLKERLQLEIQKRFQGTIEVNISIHLPRDSYVVSKKR